MGHLGISAWDVMHQTTAMLVALWPDQRKISLRHLHGGTTALMNPSEAWLQLSCIFLRPDYSSHAFFWSLTTALVHPFQAWLSRTSFWGLTILCILFRPDYLMHSSEAWLHLVCILLRPELNWIPTTSCLAFRNRVPNANTSFFITALFSACASFDRIFFYGLVNLGFIATSLAMNSESGFLCWLVSTYLEVLKIR